MNKIIFTIVMLFATSTSLLADEVMTKESDGTYVINTTTLCNKKGYKATTPLMVYIKKNKVVKVEALPSRETPKYYKRVKDLMLPLFEGKKVKEIDDVDCVTGATMSSVTVKENIKAAFEYYKKNK